MGGVVFACHEWRRRIHVIYILLTKCEGCTARILAQSLPVRSRMCLVNKRFIARLNMLRKKSCLGTGS